MTAKASRLAKVGLSVAAGLLGLTLVMTVLAATGAAVAREEQQHGVVLPVRVEGPDHPDAVMAASSVATVTVMANPTSIHVGGYTSTITATLLNESGVVISDEDAITVTFHTDLGVLGSQMVTKTTTTGVATAVLTSTADPGLATITATAESEFGVTEVYFSAPCTVQVTAYRTVIPIGGYTSTITATVKDRWLHLIFDGQVVTFTTDLGILGSDLVTRTTSGGVATAVLTSEAVAGTATITATADSVKGTTQVVITDILPGDLYWVKATAHPASILADGISTSIITATLLDVLDQPVTDETTVRFTTNLGRLGLGTSDWVTGTTTSGVVTATLTSGTTPGTAMITAWVDDKFGLTYVTFTPTGTPTPTPAPTATPTATPVARLFLPLVTKGFH